MKKYIIVGLVLSSLLSVNLYAGKKLTQTTLDLIEEVEKEVNGITSHEFKKMIDDDVEFVQLDVRENDQYGHGEIWTDEMIRLTRGYIEYKIEHKIKDKKMKIIIVCCSGKRSLLTGKTMQDLGYTNVSYLKKGVSGWIRDGYPLDTVFGELYLKR